MTNPLAELRAEVERLRDESWSEYDSFDKDGQYAFAWRALGRGRMAQTVLDLIDKHAREGQ